MCFSIEWFLQLLIFLVILCGCIAILRIWVFPFIATQAGVNGGKIAATINILIWVVVCIFIIYVVGYLLMCALGGGLGFPRIR